MTTTDRAPRWDLETIFPRSTIGRSPPRSRASSPTSIASARSTTSLDIREIEPREPTDADVAALEEVLTATNAMHEELRPVSTYLYGLVTTDSRNERGRRRHGRAADAHRRARAARRSDSASWLAALGVDEFVARSDAAAAHAFALRKAAEDAEFQMSEAEESLAAELAPSGFARVAAAARRRVVAAHGRRRGADGTIERVPMALARGLATHPDAARRRAAYDGELAAWETVAVPLAAALNGAKGELARAQPPSRLRRRPRARRCAPTTSTAATLDAMTEAVVASLPELPALLPHQGARARPRRRAARGGTCSRRSATRARSTWPHATDARARRVRRLLARARGARRRARSPSSWVDAEIRDGKRGGAYCAVGRRRRQPRDDELRRQPRLRVDARARARPRVPQRRARRAHADAAPHADGARRDRVDLLRDVALRDRRRAGRPTPPSGSRCSTPTSWARRQVVVDIHSRFLFETRAVPAPAAHRPVGAGAERRRCSTRRKRAYGDGLHPDYRHQYMWAVKPHYFTPFYNWPYTFGLLFGIGLYARYPEDPERFRAGYDDLLVGDRHGRRGRARGTLRLRRARRRVLVGEPGRAAGPHRRSRAGRGRWPYPWSPRSKLAATSPPSSAVRRPLNTPLPVVAA